MATLRAVASPQRPAVRMRDAKTYEEWKAAALADDERSGAAEWKRADITGRYDYRVIRQRYEELRSLRTAGDEVRLLYYLHEGIHGNMGGMGSPRMYRRAKFGTKDLITRYIDEQVAALLEIEKADERTIPMSEKLEFFHRASLCFGRSALMLSGAGALGPFHIGVIKALVEQDLLPKVISGSSAGALVAAIVGTRTAQALHEVFRAANIIDVYDEAAEAEADLIKGNRRLSIREIRGFIEHQIPDLTFEEAFEISGRHINISVSPRDLHQQPRLLNAITSPNVYIREAVMASCAIPGIYPAVTLAARNRLGERQPYVPTRQWVDGSITADLPAKRLSRLYGVNHFITSQTNPVVLWALRDSQAQDSLFERWWEIHQHASREWMRATYPFAMELTRDLYPLNIMTRMFYSIATQDYTADVNILPRRRYWDPRRLLALLSDGEVRELIAEGEAAAWPRIEMIRNCTAISRTLDAILDRLGQQQVYGHNVEAIF